MFRFISIENYFRFEIIRNFWVKFWFCGLNTGPYIYTYSSSNFVHCAWLSKCAVPFLETVSVMKASTTDAATFALSLQMHNDIVLIEHQHHNLMHEMRALVPLCAFQAPGKERSRCPWVKAEAPSVAINMQLDVALLNSGKIN